MCLGTSGRHQRGPSCLFVFLRPLLTGSPCCLCLPAKSHTGSPHSILVSSKPPETPGQVSSWSCCSLRQGASTCCHAACPSLYCSDSGSQGCGSHGTSSQSPPRLRCWPPGMAPADLDPPPAPTSCRQGAQLWWAWGLHAPQELGCCWYFLILPKNVCHLFLKSSSCGVGAVVVATTWEWKSDLQSWWMTAEPVTAQLVILFSLRLSLTLAVSSH